MASEIRGASGSGNVLYAHILNAAGQRWNGTAFETYNSGNWATYDIALTEQAGSGVYVGDFPSTIQTAGSYEYFVYLESTGAPATGDQIVATGIVYWNGTAETDIIQGSMSGVDFLAYVKRLFKRTDKDTEIYDAITDAISELRRIYSFDESQVEVTLTDTITLLGDWKLSLETDFGLLEGITVIDGDSGRSLVKVSKEVFDSMFPNPLTASRGYPGYFCIYAGEIQFGYVPDKLTYTYRITYSKGGETISAATTSVPFTKNYREPLREGVLAKVWSGLDEQLAAEHQAKWEFFKNQIQIREENNQKGTGFVMYRGV